MRHGRAKQTRRTLQFFERTVGIRAPYNVLIDGTFIIASLKYKIPLQDRLSKLLQQSPYKLFFLSGTLSELHSLKQQTKESHLFDAAIKFLRSNCTKLEQTTPSSPPDDASPTAELSRLAADLYRFVAAANESKGTPSYIVASQDEDLLGALRSGVTVPLVRLAHQTVLLLERASKQRQQHNEELERHPDAVFEEDAKTSKVVETERTTTHGRMQRHKARAPNPLSCKKKKKRVVDEQPSQDDQSKNKRKRRRRKKETSTGSATDEP